MGEPNLSRVSDATASWKAIGVRVVVLPPEPILRFCGRCNAGSHTTTPKSYDGWLNNVAGNLRVAQGRIGHLGIGLAGHACSRSFRYHDKPRLQISTLE
jgi:hypothetical protein